MHSLLVCCNFTPVTREKYEFGVPEEGFYEEVLNTDSAMFGGSNVGNGGMVSSRPVARHDRKFSIAITLPPLAVVYFKPDIGASSQTPPPGRAPQHPQ